MNQGAPGTATTPTLWDRTRQLASKEILDTALRLFTEQGYDETTLAQVAREAGVSQRTLFRYFGSKEDLLGDDQHKFGEVLMATVSSQPEGADAWQALRAGFVATLDLHDSRDQALQRFRLLHTTGSLRAGWLQKRLRFSEDLLPLIRARMHGMDDTTYRRPRAVIATAFACLDVATMTWVDNHGRGEIIDLYDACLSDVRS